MQWDQLLSDIRYTPTNTSPTGASGQPTDFQADAERILYSSAFRRLQGKTQVYPLPSFDYLRTRLTHTIEVAHVGRVMASILCCELGDEVLEYGERIPDIVYAACLAHDLGNPPFGHIGEHAIQTWFERHRHCPALTAMLDDTRRRSDFLKFDGNAQGFRILTRLTGWRQDGGLQLTYAVLGAFSKYPFSSHYALKNKFGFMSDDTSAAVKVFHALGMGSSEPYNRHPLALLVEAADDISYLTTDIDDAHRMGRLKFLESENFLKSIASAGNRMPRYNELLNSGDRDKISYLRSGASKALIEGVVRSFIDHKDAVMDGTFSGSLLEASTYKKNTDDIRDTCKKLVYTEQGKVQLEAAGYNVIMSLMDIFGGMMIQLLDEKSIDKLDLRNRGILSLLPEDFKSRLSPTNPYRTMLVLVDYITGMTDRFALDLFQRLTGYSAALGRMA